MCLMSRYCRHFLLTVATIAFIGILTLADSAWAANSGIINGSVVNVRSGPGVSYNVAGTILGNTEVHILQTQDNWVQIQFGKLTGWVSSPLITAAQSAEVLTEAASDPGTTAAATLPPQVLLDGKILSFDVPPVIENGRTLVPLRAIFEAMGATVEWDQAAQTVTAVKGNTTVVLPLNSTSPTVNGVVYPLDTTAKIVNDRTLAPLRFVSEAFGGTVTWDEAANTITLTLNSVTEYPVVQEYIDNNRPGTSLDPVGQVVHATADPGASATDIRNYFNNHPNAEASTHAVIDWNSIIELIPENEIAWHAGPTANHAFLSFEMCEPVTDDPDRCNKFQEVWNRAVWYCAKTCVKYGWKTNDNLFSHNGISEMYPNETNHTDPYGYFAAYGKTWDEFLADVDINISELQ